MQVRVFGDDLGDVMIHDEPVHFIEARFKGEIRDPRGAFAEFALFPEIVMVGLQRHRLAVELFRQPLQQQAGDQAVEVAFMGENNLRLGQRQHEAQTNSIGRARRAGNFFLLPGSEDKFSGENRCPSAKVRSGNTKASTVKAMTGLANGAIL